MLKRMWNPATFSCKNSKYFTSIIDNLVITCAKLIEMEGTIVELHYWIDSC